MVILVGFGVGFCRFVVLVGFVVVWVCSFVMVARLVVCCDLLFLGFFVLLLHLLFVWVCGLLCWIGLFRLLVAVCCFGELLLGMVWNYICFVLWVVFC